MGNWGSARSRGAGLLVAALACLALAATPALAAEPVGDPPAAMYEPNTVDVIRLTLSPASKQKLEEDPEGDYVEGTFSIATSEGTPGTVGAFSAPALVGIRLKGKYGSFRTLAQKAGFKIKFNFENALGEKGKKYLGLKKMTLNNMVQDTSLIHERLAYAAFRAAGVPSPRTGYAYLEVNGEDFGLHLNIETIDDVALEKRFGPFQHLYEGAYGSDVAAGGAGSFEIDEGDEGDVADMNALIAAVNGSDPADFSDRVRPFADLVEMTRMWAVERYLGHWDGYTTKNNYYLLSDPLGRFQMLPWGTDQTWDSHLAFDGGGGLLFSECLADTSCAALYRKSLRQAQAALDGLGLDSLAQGTGALLAPWAEKEFDNARREHSPGEIAADVQDTRNFIAARPAELATWLAGQPAEAPATEVALAPLAPIVADGAATTTATATVTDAEGDPVPGDFLSFTAADPGVKLGAVRDNGDGTYAVTVTASTAAATSSITVTDSWPGPDLSDTATLIQVPGPAAQLSLALQPGSIPADGATATTATATAADAHGNPVAGDQVSFSSSDPGVVIGPVADHGDGSYSAQVTASKAAGPQTITVTDGAVAPALTATASLTQSPLLPSPGGGNSPSPSTPQSEPPSEPQQSPPSTRPLPLATITAKPAKRGRDHTPTFRFGSDDPTASFRCRVDGRPFRPCSSPSTLSSLAAGSHTFEVRAVDASGRGGPAASFGFFVKPQRPRH